MPSSLPFAVVSPGFFEGERWGNLKDITSPRRGYRGGSRAMVTTFKILRQFKLLETESIFQKYQHFSWPKSIFSRKKFRKLKIFDKNFWFSEIFFKFHLFIRWQIPRHIQWILVSTWEIYHETKNAFDGEGLLEIEWKFLKILEKIDCTL